MDHEKDRAGTIEVSYETLLGDSPEFREAVATAEDVLEGAALIRQMRAAADEGAGIGKSELARRLGVTPARVSALEKGEGRQGPTYALLKRVARACGLEFDARRAVIDPRCEGSSTPMTQPEHEARNWAKIYKTLETLGHVKSDWQGAWLYLQHEAFVRSTQDAVSSVLGASLHSEMEKWKISADSAWAHFHQHTEKSTKGR